MKKYNHFFIFIMLIASIIAPINKNRAGDVDKAKASQVGAYFLASQFGNKAITAESLTLVHEIRNAVRDIPALYVFNTADNRGCVIVAGSDCMDPIIAYSTDEAFDPTNIPDNLRWWLDGYVNYITYAQNNQVQPTAQNIESWAELTEERLPYFGNQTKAEITTLLTTKWDQDPYYNLFAPKIGSTHCYAGCVATALGQIVKYWGYPIKGQGQKSYRWTTGGNWLRASFDTVYDYANMPIELTASSTTTEVIAVARLLYHLGIAVEMDYGINPGSGASSIKVPGALAQYFKYENTGTYIDRTRDSRFYNNTGVVNAKDSAWVDILRNEILNKRPVYYDGTDPAGEGRDAAGHAFVCDGYNSTTDKFRFNWGWGGTGNRLWFNVYVGALNVPAGGYNFSSGHGMCYNITPPLDSIPYDMRPGTEGIDITNNPFTAAVYPNPAQEQVTVSYELPSGNAANLQVIDINGRVVKHFTIQPSSNQITFSVSDLRPGIYLCRMQGHTTKFIVK